ncbi:MAG TPA: hypothetical protein DD412_02890 [Holosporales bacterium]|nr:hypothetical protein [Holosporales bacterium]
MVVKMLHILMVDDEPDLDMLIQQRFRREIREGQFSFSFSRNGERALEILRENPDISLIVTDLNMPEMNGIELLIQVKKSFPEKKMIVISAYSDQDSIKTATNAGADGFLFKPLNFQDFEHRIRECAASASNS